MTLLPLFGALVSCEVAGVLSPGCPSSPRGLEGGDLASRASGVPSQLPRALGGEHPGNFGATSVGCALFVLTHLLLLRLGMQYCQRGAEPCGKPCGSDSGAAFAELPLEPCVGSWVAVRHRWCRCILIRRVRGGLPGSFVLPEAMPRVHSVWS